MTDLRRVRSAQNAEGFTLVEVLVVLALVSLLTGLLFGSLRFGIGAWDKITSRASMTDQIMLVQDFLRRTISAAYPQFIVTDPTHGRVDFLGTETSMSFMAPTPIARGSEGRSRFTISLGKNGGSPALIVTSQLELLSSEAVSNVSDVLMTNLSGVEFSYFGKGRSGQLEWRDGWTNEVVLPQLMRIRVKFPDGDVRMWPDLTVAPRIDADVSCVYDLLTKRCRGR